MTTAAAGVVGSSTASRQMGFVRSLRSHPSAVAGLVILGFFIITAALAPIITPDPPGTNVGPAFAPPSAGHWLGLDDGGADIVTLLIWGARVSLLVGFASAALAITIGATVGIAAGYFGGRSDSALMRTTDYFLVIPDVPLMIIVAALFGASIDHTILIIGLLLWTWTARVVRAQTKSLRERAYVKRTKALGGSDARIIFHHILPHLMPLIVASAVLAISVAIFAETALAFLGLGDPSSISWGKILRSAFERTAISNGAWWAVVPPGLCIALVVFGCQLLGRTIQDALNPRLRVSHLAPGSPRLVDTELA